MIPTWLLLALAPFSTYRVASLIQNDEISRPTRELIQRFYSDGWRPRWFWYVAEWVLDHCMWCLGVYTAAIWVLWWRLWPSDVFDGLNLVAALSLAPPVIDAIIDRIEGE